VRESHRRNFGKVAGMSNSYAGPIRTIKTVPTRLERRIFTDPSSRAFDKIADENDVGSGARVRGREKDSDAKIELESDVVPFVGVFSSYWND